MIIQPEKILVRSPNWIGDQLLALPFFYFLRQAYPRAEITVSCLPWVQSVQFRNWVDRVIPLTQPEDDGIWARWKAWEASAQRLRESGPWDLGICLPQSFSSAWILARSRVSKRRGYLAEGRGLLLNEGVPGDDLDSLHRSEEYVKLLSREIQNPGPVRDFWGVPAENPLDSGTPGVLSGFDPAGAWPEISPIEPPSEKYWILAPGSMAESRRWPETHWIGLARTIAQETSWKGLIVGGGLESSVAERLVQDSSLRLENWTQRGMAPAYWKVFRQSQFAVCNDSGLAHLAALCGSRVQVIWGAGRVQKTRPIGPGMVKLSVNPVECWPCERNECLRTSGQKLECLLGISPDAVWKEIAPELK
jgi:heptosyltransferase-2